MGEILRAGRGAPKYLQSCNRSLTKLSIAIFWQFAIEEEGLYEAIFLPSS
jgi:hypothetical protein